MRNSNSPSAVSFFSIWVLFHEYSRITGLQWKGEGIPLTPHYHFHLLYKHLDISRAITAESSPLHIASNPIRTVSCETPDVTVETDDVSPATATS